MTYSTRIIIDIATDTVLAKDRVAYDGPWAKCDRSINSAAKANAKNAGATGATFGAEAGQERGSVVPGLEREAQGQQGFSPTDLNNMSVSAMQGIGGSNAGITGQANLEAARTRNAGGFAGALDEASRNKDRALGNSALNIQNENAQQKQSNQKFAQGQLTGLVGQDSNSMLKAMGLQDQDLNTGLKADQTGWFQDFNQLMQTLEGGAKAAAAFK